MPYSPLQLVHSSATKRLNDSLAVEARKKHHCIRKYPQFFVHDSRVRPHSLSRSDLVLRSDQSGMGKLSIRSPLRPDLLKLIAISVSY